MQALLTVSTTAGVSGDQCLRLADLITRMALHLYDYGGDSNDPLLQRSRQPGKGVDAPREPLQEARVAGTGRNMTSIACPHQTAAERQCSGCKQGHDGAVRCEGEIEGRVYRDSDGDPGVIYGVRTFWAVEDETADCDCALTEAEWEKVREKLVERGSEPDEDDYL